MMSDFASIIILKPVNLTPFDINQFLEIKISETSFFNIHRKIGKNMKKVFENIMKRIMC